jgi:tetratricopeptide (TPR) repeat protein
VHYGMTDVLPKTKEEIQIGFEQWLRNIPGTDRIIIILDSLNQLEDRDGATDLVWIPRIISSRVRLIVSTLPGQSLDRLNEYKWQKLHVMPLGIDERKNIIVEYLAQYRKSLNKDRLAFIASARQCSNPLYLRALLEELRVFGYHEDLDIRINYYLAAKNLEQLYEKILDRYNKDYLRIRHHLPMDAFSLIWSSRGGLMETELLEILGYVRGLQLSDSRWPDELIKSINMEYNLDVGYCPLPAGYWSPLFISNEQSLTNCNGYIKFSNEYMRLAVEKRYMSKEAKRIRHIQLAEFFTISENVSTERRVDETLWHLWQAEEWKELYDMLSEPKLLKYAWAKNKYDILRYWTGIEKNSNLDMLSAYKWLINNPLKDEDTAWCLVYMLEETNRLKTSVPIRKSLLRNSNKHNRMEQQLASYLFTKGRLLENSGDITGAQRKLREALTTYIKIGDLDGQSACLRTLGLLVYKNGELDAAMRYFNEALDICEKLHDLEGKAECINNVGLTLEKQCNIDKAMQRYKEALAINEQLGNLSGKAANLNNIASLLVDGYKDLKGAQKYYEESLAINVLIGDLDGEVTALNNIGGIKDKLGECENAIQHYRKALSKNKQLGDVRKDATILGNIGSIQMDKKNYASAVRYFQRAIKLQMMLKNPIDLGNSYANLISALYGVGRIDKAKSYSDQFINHMSENKLITNPEIYRRAARMLLENVNVDRVIACLAPYVLDRETIDDITFEIREWYEIEALSREEKAICWISNQLTANKCLAKVNLKLIKDGWTKKEIKEMVATVIQVLSEERAN